MPPNPDADADAAQTSAATAGAGKGGGGLGENILADPNAAQTFITEVTTRLQNLEGISGAFEVKIAALEIGVSAQEDQRVRAETGITEAFRQIQEVQEALRILNIHFQTAQQ